MRPERLEIEGFASFRERTLVDFTGADLFVLFGPTGAGKSSIIDAITFALYGAVPRYDNVRLVAPVISQGLNEARIRLDFSAGGKTYTAVRVVRRTRTGATTREARLEHDGRTLAGNADELTAEVEKLVGLPFQHFTRCVVLPQGDFADFLHASAGERQDLLIRLLSLDVYRRIAQQANLRAQDAANRAALIGGQLEGPLACATDEALAAAAARVDELTQLLEVLDAGRTQLEDAISRKTAAENAEREVDARVRLLEALRMPPDAERLARDVAEAEATLVAAGEALAEAFAAREQAEAARAALPERAALKDVIDRHDRRAALEQEAQRANAALDAAQAAADAAAAAEEEARTRVAQAEERLQQVRRDRAAAHLAQHLHAGEPCPVCHQKVKKLPEHAPPPDLHDAQEERATADKALEQASAHARRAAAELAGRRSAAEAARANIEALDAGLAGAPAREQAAAQLAEIEGLEHALDEARKRERAAHEAQKRASKHAAGLRDRQATARRTFNETHHALARAGLAPPSARLEDLAADWRALVEWGAEQIVVERAAAARHREAAAAALRDFEALATEQLRACAEHDVPVPPRQDPRTACADALAAARAQHERIARDLETANRLREERAALERQARTARDLGRHLDARNFERWLMNRALRQLVAGATRTLLQLSGGAYSLSVDEKGEFHVIDHRNADESRLARTLSGGETFLASLALALALAENVAQMAGSGATRLDALFLDEGFGTLDGETLDTVATAIEELGSTGRMVGIVTHVRELADRVPVRFDVTRTGSVSSIRRVG